MSPAFRRHNARIGGLDENVVLTTMGMAGEGKPPGGARRLPEEKAADPVWTCTGLGASDRAARPQTSPQPDRHGTHDPEQA